jgi:translation initiation factor IF-3
LVDRQIALEKKARKNHEILTPRVRLIGGSGEQVGILPTREALQMAEEAGLDLVEVSPTADPPVCRIMDYGKFVYEQHKKSHAAKRKQKQIEVKEVKFRPGTEDGDYQVKLRNLTRFLTEGDKAKITLRFRGRELLHMELGREMLRRIQADLGELAVVESFPRLEGKQMVMLLAPKKKVQQ